MKTSFENIDSDDSEQKNPTASAVVPQAKQELVDDQFFANDGFEGDVDKNAIRTPYLSLVHGVGDLAEAGFNPGSLVFNKETVMAQPSKGVMAPADGVTVILLGGFLEYIEDISNDEFNAGIKPKRFRKESEARAAGLISVKERRDSGDEEARVFRPALQLKVLMQGKGDEGFPLEFEGKSYTLAAVGCTKGSYWGAGTVIQNFINECRMVKKPISRKSFQLFTKLEKFPGSANAVWSIKAAPGPVTSEALQNWIKELGA